MANYQFKFEGVIRFNAETKADAIQRMKNQIQTIVNEQQNVSIYMKEVE